MDDVKVLPELPIAELLFKYQEIDEITLPEQPGSLWHGIFGRELREQVCSRAVFSPITFGIGVD